MFGSKDRDQPGSAGQSPGGDARPASRSHIAQGMTISGDIEGDIDLLLDGTLEGNLRCRSVTIGKSGKVHGRIVAQEAVVDGAVEGDIDAKTVRLNVTAEMIGDVRHEVIEVAAGARIEGNYSRRDAKPKTAAGAGVQSGGHGKPTVQSSKKTETADPPPKAPASLPASARPAETAAAASSAARDSAAVALESGSGKPS
jgi:cytoskeletal protein CcmA (bactofilin family)